MLNGCRTTKIFCRENCPPGRRTKPENRLRFRTTETAIDAGYRACLVCRPLNGGEGPWRSARELKALSRNR